MDGTAVFWVPVLLLLLGGLGYLFRRQLEGSHESEKAKVVRDWIEIHKAMYGTTPTIEDINRLRASFLYRSKQLKSEQSGDLEIIKIEHSPDPIPNWMFFGYELSEWEREQARDGAKMWTQLELNERAHLAFKAIEPYIEAEVSRWKAVLTDEEWTYFEHAQAAWRSYREAQSTFSASTYKGGTIAPLIYWGEMFDKTQQRLVDLEKARDARERL